MITTRSLAYCLLVTISFVHGCARSNSGAGNLSGKLTLGERPIRAGRVYIISKDGKRATSAEVQDDGSYAIADAPIGDVKISFQPPENVQLTEKVAINTKVPGLKAISATAARSVVGIPSHYLNHETSGITFNVKEGDNIFDIKLKRSRW